VTIRSVLLAGGAGTRLWPLSTEERPKQFLRLWGDRSLLQEAYRRVAAASERVRVATAERYAERTLSELPELSRDDLLLEPARRNTAAAILVASLVLAEEGDAPVAIVPADQTVADDEAFRACLRAAGEAAESGKEIVVLGVPPDRAEVEYGYVEVGAGTGPRRVERFVEKPDVATAERYRASGRFLWNAGIFVFRPSSVIAEAAITCPELLAACRRYRDRPSRESYEEIPAMSFDYAVMERATNVACVPCEAGWNDVGSYRALKSLGRIDVRGNLVIADRPVVIDGVRDCVIAVSPDGALVFPFAREGDLRRILADGLAGRNSS
jgi:mannose-1-phosphate guanylyltransferase / mannose-6-phosphate isomerase